ncbi:hypothetical protein H0H93_009920 [Arthromyces matolae]|nr:hypothetical protein H0H93_009920 [Arthromyces matolae]
MLQSAFYISEAVGVLYWGRLSDRIGRKPVILIGLVGIACSSLCFGLSKGIWGLLLSRCLCGALNGNAGVIKSMLPELASAEHLPVVSLSFPRNNQERLTMHDMKLWGFMPLSWTIGATLGPVVGGYLSHPAERFPSLFGECGFLRTYPYFLPCAFPAFFSVIAWIAVFKFLEETVQSPVNFYDLLKSSPEGQRASRKPIPLRHIINSRTIISIGHYALSALLEMAFRAIQPLFLATPVQFGGLELSPPSIGSILSTGGAVTGVAQLFVFPLIHRRLGSKSTFVIGLVLTIPVFLSFPIAHLLLKRSYVYLLWATICLQSFMPLGYFFSFGAIFMYITAAAPDRASLGTTHGLSQVCLQHFHADMTLMMPKMTISLMRAIGPIGANGLFALSSEKNYLGGYLVYYVLFLMTCIVVALSEWLLPRQTWNQ